MLRRRMVMRQELSWMRTFYFLEHKTDWISFVCNELYYSLKQYAICSEN